MNWFATSAVGLVHKGSRRGGLFILLLCWVVTNLLTFTQLTGQITNVVGISYGKG